MRCMSWLIGGLLVGCFFVSPAIAQDGGGPPRDPNEGDILFAGIPFNFLPPGARALAMGGTFIAIADDATAAEANPAGLTILSRPEVSVHYRSSSFQVEGVDLFAAFINDNYGDFARGFQPLIDPIITFEEDVNDIAFASYVHPFDRWTLSISYQQAVNFRGRSEINTTQPELVDFIRTRRQVDALVEYFALSGAAELTDWLSLGVSVRFSQADFQTLDELRSDFPRDFELDFGNLNFDDVLLLRSTLDGTDDDVTFNVGLLFNPNGTVSGGLVYKQGGSFVIDGMTTFVDCLPFECNESDGRFLGAFVFEEESDTAFELPDLIGGGLAWRPTDQVIVALDLNYLFYSNLDNGGGSEPIDDELEIHLGAEYTIFLERSGGDPVPIFLRAGAWTDPDHDGFRQIDSEQTHFTLGAGIVLGGLQIDAAGHFSDLVDEFLVSLVYRF
ncbi:MAG: outer membrane protein transport protein [Acidobacteriota bacterium]